MIELSGYENALRNLPSDIRAAEINAERIRETRQSIKSGSISHCRAYDRTKLYVRASGVRTGMVYTEKLDAEPADVLRTAVENARFSGASGAEPMNVTGGGFVERPYAAVSTADLLAFGAEVEKQALALPGLSRVVECTVTESVRDFRVFNSYCFDSGSAAGYVQAELTVAAKRDGEPAIGTARVSGASLSRLDAGALVHAAALDAALYDGGGLAPCKFHSGIYDAVLTGRVMRNILMTAWMELSGHAMLSGASVFHGEPGEQIGSEALRFVNAPEHPLLGQCWPVDSEGTRCKSTLLVDRGRLITPLYTLASGTAAGKNSTGSTGRVARMTGDVPISLTTVPAVLYADVGEGDATDLIRRMGTGLLVTYSLDLFHSVNVASGEFSIPCGGVWYENGMPVGTVSQATMAGNIRDLWRSIEQMGSDLDFDDFYFRTYCVGSPSALVRGLTFAC